MAQLLSSKVVVVEETPRLRSFPTIPTAVAAVVGVTEKGPIRTPTRVTSFDEWVDIFGGFISDSKLAAMVEQFFNNGGTDLFTSRVVHYNSILDPNTKTSAAATKGLNTTAVPATAGTILGGVQAPFTLTPADTLDVDVDAGGPATAIFNATRASLQGAGTEPHALSNGDTLIFSIDQGPTQTIQFLAADFANIATATSQEVADVLNRDGFGFTASVVFGSVVIASDREGSGSEVHVTGGTANVVLSFSTTASPGTGNVAFIDAVTAAEVKTIVEAAVAGCTVTDVNGRVQIESNTTGIASSIQVNATSTADQLLGFDNAVHTGTDAGTYLTLTVNGKYDGAYANVYRVLISDPTSNVAGEFNMTLLQNGASVEVFPNVNMVPGDANYVVDVVAATSTRIAVVDEAAATTDVLAAPKKGNFALAGGDDGLTGLLDTDYTGSQAGGTGFFAFDAEPEITVIAAPDRPTAPVQNALVDYADIVRERTMFAVVTTPADLSATGVIAWVQNTANLINKAEVSAVYWPYISILNPSTQAFGSTDTITLAPTMSVMGVYARTDSARDGGVYDEPAGEERGIVAGALGVATTEVLEERKRDLVVPKHINPIRFRPGTPVFIDDSLVLKRNGNFPTVAQRRGVIFIERSVKDGMEVFRQNRNDEDTRNEVENSIRGFLLVQFANEAFRGETPEDSFFVDASDKVNTPLIVAQEKLIVRIGLATQRPARFIILRFSQDLRDVAAEIAGG
jgi:hypothetical protein